MITDDERFIEIQGILAFSDVHPTDCIKINDLIIELSKQNKELKDNWNKLKEWLEETQINKVDIDEWTIIQVRDKMQEIEGGMNE